MEVGTKILAKSLIYELCDGYFEIDNDYDCFYKLYGSHFVCRSPGYLNGSIAGFELLDETYEIIFDSHQNCKYCLFLKANLKLL